MKDVTKGIVELQYDFITGTHSPTKLSQFKGVIKTLQRLHRENIVHGDIRVCNIVFTQDSSHLIDYDLAQKALKRYPVRYNAMESERHQGMRNEKNS